MQKLGQSRENSIGNMTAAMQICLNRVSGSKHILLFKTHVCGSMKCVGILTQQSLLCACARIVSHSVS